MTKVSKAEMLEKLMKFFSNFSLSHGCTESKVHPLWNELIDKNGFPHIRADSDKFCIELRPVFSSFELDIENKVTRVIYVLTFSNSIYRKDTNDWDYNKDEWGLSQFRVDGVEGDIQAEIYLLQTWIKQIGF